MVPPPVPRPPDDGSPGGLELLILLARLGKLNDLAITGLLRTLPHPEVHGYGQAECMVLTELYRRGSPHRSTPTELSRVSLQSASGMTKTLTRLADAGLIVRHHDANDRRSLLVELTGKGAAIAAQNVAHTARRYDEMLQGVPADALADILDKLRLLLGVFETAAGAAPAG